MTVGEIFVLCVAHVKESSANDIYSVFTNDLFSFRTTIRMYVWIHVTYG